MTIIITCISAVSAAQQQILCTVGVALATQAIAYGGRSPQQGKNSILIVREAASYVSLRGYSVLPFPQSSLLGAWKEALCQDSIAISLLFANFPRQLTRNKHYIKCIQILCSPTAGSHRCGSKFLKVPSVVILNQIKLLLSPRLHDFAVPRIFENVVGEFMGSMWAMAERVLVPDLPPPYTLSGHNIWDIGSASRKIEYIGFASPRPQISEEQVIRVANMLGFDRIRPLVFVHVSGPTQTRPAFLQLAVEAAKRLIPRSSLSSQQETQGEKRPSRIGSQLVL